MNPLSFCPVESVPALLRIRHGIRVPCCSLHRPDTRWCRLRYSRAGRIAKLMKELNFKPQKTGLIVNRVPDGKLDAGTLEEIRNQGLELLGVVPNDDQVYQYDCDGKPIIQLPKDSPVRSALEEIVKKLGL